MARSRRFDSDVSLLQFLTSVPHAGVADGVSGRDDFDPAIVSNALLRSIDAASAFAKPTQLAELATVGIDMLKSIPGMPPEGVWARSVVFSQS